MMDRCQEDLFVRETLKHTKETLEHVKTELSETRERNRYLESVNEEVRWMFCCSQVCLSIDRVLVLFGTNSCDSDWRPRCQGTRQRYWLRQKAACATPKSNYP